MDSMSVASVLKGVYELVEQLETENRLLTGILYQVDNPPTELMELINLPPNEIVARVRHECHVGNFPHQATETFLEAADEIERLRVKISKLKALMNDVLTEAYHD